MNDPKANDAISRSAVLEVLHKNVYVTGYAYKQFAEDIKALPSLDAAPVVHAYWIKTFGSDGFVSTLRCSRCGNAENSTYIPGNFCWFCGSKMDGEAE